MRLKKAFALTLLLGSLAQPSPAQEAPSATVPDAAVSAARSSGAQAAQASGAQAAQAAQASAAQASVAQEAGKPEGASDADPQVNVDVDVDEENPDDKNDFLGRGSGSMSLGSGEGFGIGSAIGDPTALVGPDRTEVVLDGTTRSSTVSISGYYLYKPADNQQILVEANVDPAFVGADLSYSIQPKGWDGVLTANMFLSSARFAPFQEATPKVLLPNLEEPFLQQGGFGLEYVQEINRDLDLAVAASYQNFAFSDSLFGGTRFPRDNTGMPLAFGDSATGDIYSLNVHGIYSTMDDRLLPTEGTKIRFGVEESVALGSSSSAYTRLAANLSQLIKAPGFNDGDHSLLVNVQTGTILGTPPQLRAFHMGGPFSVRGYQPGQMASGTSFFQGSLEYRHHLTNFTVKDYDIDLRAAAFVDYGTVLGTQRRVQGVPEYLWDKPNHGTGYGVGLHFATKAGLFRLESAWNDQGNSTVYVSVGERF